MSEMTILLSVDPEENRFRFFVVELRALEDGGAELHRRWGRIGTEGRHEVEEFSTVPLAQAARRALIDRRRRRGYVRAQSLCVPGADLGALAACEVGLTVALERMRRELVVVRENQRSPEASSQLALPL